MALVFSTQSPTYYKEFRQHMAQIKLNTIQIVLMAHYKNLLIQIILMAHICENDMIQIKDMFKIVAKRLQFSTEEYSIYTIWTPFSEKIFHALLLCIWYLRKKLAFFGPITLRTDKGVCTT